MKLGFKNVAVRIENANAWLVETIANFGGIDTTTASKVADFYVKSKLAKRDVAQGKYTFSHGAVLDRAVILRAVAMIGA